MSTPIKIATLALIGLQLSLVFPVIKCGPLNGESEYSEGHEGPVNSPPAKLTVAPVVSDPFALFKGFADMSSFVSSFSAPKALPVLPSLDDKPKVQEKETGILGVKEPIDFLKFFLSPLELINSIAKAFNLDGPKFEKSVGRGLDLSMETALQPPIACIKIIEKVFVPDSCMLKFVCEMGKQLAMFKGQMPKFPDSYFEGASTAKAFYDGASGRECHHVYDCREGEGPVLKKEFLGLKNKMFGEQDSNEGGYEKSL